MTSRERISTILNGGIPDRVGMHESFWNETIEKWHKEGLPTGQCPDDYFETEIRTLTVDISFQFPEEVFEETDEYIIKKDSKGVTLKEIKGESGHTPQWMEHTIKGREDWMRYKERLKANENRIPIDTVEQYERFRHQGKFIAFGGPEAYEGIWPVLGQVRIFTLMMDEPELIKDMFSTFTDLIIDMAEMLISKGIDFDGAFFWGDLGYRNSLLFSPQLYNNLLFPHHKRMCDYFKSKGKPVMLHSCGKIESLIPKFIEAGFSAIQPLEAKVGQDVRKLKKEYGNSITLFGNIDVRKLSGTKEEIEEEIRSKLEVAKEGGGYIFHSDHSIPPAISFQNYQFAWEMVKKYGTYHSK